MHCNNKQLELYENLSYYYRNYYWITADICSSCLKGLIPKPYLLSSEPVLCQMAVDPVPVITVNGTIVIACRAS